MIKFIKHKIITKTLKLILVTIMVISLVIPMKMSAFARNIGDDISGIKLGDITKDGNIDIYDILSIQRHILGVETISENMTTVADVTGDGEIDIYDILEIQRYILGITTEDDKENNITGMVTNISNMQDSEFQKPVYCSPDASASGTGTSSSPMTLEAALTLSKTTDGIAIILEEGTYSYNKQITIPYGDNGSVNAYKILKAADGAKVTLDFSSQIYGDTSTNARGLQIEGNYWYFNGITVAGAADNGIYLAGSNNVIERCITKANRDSGMQISRRNSSLSNIADWPSNNYILNCTSYDNNDPATHENADGYAAKLTCGEGNVFDGCISYCNIDDGWDLYAKPETGSIGVVTLRNCISFSNGTMTDGTTSTSGDRNGFKLGGSDRSCPTPHIVYNCLAFNNGATGFTDNGNGAALSVSNCTSYNNTKGNFNFYRTTGGKFVNLISILSKSTDKFVGTINNSIYCNNGNYYKVLTETSVANGQIIGTAIAEPSNSDFVSMTVPGITADIDLLFRNLNGTITTSGYLKTNSNRDLTSFGAEFGMSTSTLSLNAATQSVVK